MSLESVPSEVKDLEKKVNSPPLSEEVIERRENSRSRAAALLIHLNAEYPNGFTNDFDSFSLVADSQFEDLYGSIASSNDQSYVDLKACVILAAQNKAFYDYVEKWKMFLSTEK